MTRRRHAFPSERFKRRTEWARQVQAVSIAANTNFFTYDMLTDFKGVGGQQQQSTVVRNHVRLVVTSVTLPGEIFSWGILKGQNTDVGANIAGAPDPFHDHYEDWMWWETCVAAGEGSTGQPACYWPPMTNVQDVDVKAKRRLEGLQESLNLVVYRQSVAASALTLTITSSTLLMLP
jgi:hypothetical protein